MSPYILKIFIPIHIFFMIAVVLLITKFSLWMIFAIMIGWFITGCIGTEIGLHRLYSHKTFEIKSDFLKVFICWAACMSGQWSPIFWAALHRGYHHPRSDTKEDIHSPVNGYWNAFVGWLFSLKRRDVRLSFVQDLIKDPIHVYFHDYYVQIFWASIVALGFLGGLDFVLIGVVIPIMLAMYQENLVNLICHIKTPFSYRNFETKDNSQNVYILGLLFWGQGFHNNHHARPNEYDFGFKKSEIDICKWVVPSLIYLDKCIMEDKL